MQSSDGTLHLLPALPDVWPNGRMAGLRARGGFELIDMEWKAFRLVKVSIRSNLGGNLRLRVPNAISVNNGGTLMPATGGNSNPFYYVEETPSPIISPNANIQPLKLKVTTVYDILTTPGKVYTFIAQ